jgi:DNA-binding NtrC family response regulator
MNTPNPPDDRPRRYSVNVSNRTDAFPAISDKEMQEYQKQLAAGTLSAFQLIEKMDRCDYEVALDKLITNDDEMNRAKAQITNIRCKTNNNCSVLITGPSGTGKEILARGLLNADTPFVSVNCAALPKDLISSLFFGHTKGSFTGAILDKEGYLISAENGIIFLDEIADFPLDQQGTLLRAIQERVVTKVGSIAEQEINCRFVGATKYDLRERVEKDLFREDLFARLMTFEVRTTSLKQRHNDIPLIAEKGIGVDGLPMCYTDPIPITHDISKYNVRGIQNYVQRMKTYGYAS